MWSNISASASANIDALSSSPHSGHSSDLAQQQPAAGSPLMRYKHALCAAAQSGLVYLHGGKFGNVPLDDDVWRFDPHQNLWSQLTTTGSKPPSLQDHTMLEHNDQLYMFGGQVSTSNLENSFWRLDLVTNEWHSLSLKSSRQGAHLGPTSRRGHTAVMYAGLMYIYGGFEDFRGSSGQLWEYDMGNHRWQLRDLSSSSACRPEPRHGHSAIVHQDSMYIYGGLCNLKHLGDLWRWCWRERRWFRERTRGKSPGQLHGHSAVAAFNSMFVFGGERQGRPSRSLWRLDLARLVWHKVRPRGPRPSPCTWHGAVANPLGMLDQANYIIEADRELLRATAASPDEAASLACFSGAPSPAGAPGGQPAAVAAAAAAASETAPKPEAAPRHQSSAGAIKRDPEHDQGQYVAGAPLTSLRHSRSTSDQQQAPDRGRRVRLGAFERRGRRPERPASSYELKDLAGRQPPAVRPRPLTSTADGGRRCAAAARVTGNAHILDNLDTDIKQMFEAALEREPDEASQTRHTHTSTLYDTAVQAASEASGPMSRSQRTSYAYATPPSEPLTLMGSQPSMSQASSATLSGVTPRSAAGPQTGSTLATESPPWPSKGHRPRSPALERGSRPKSEIVQSLIERADARIKHMYTPYFDRNTGKHGDDLGSAHLVDQDGGRGGQRVAKQARLLTNEEGSPRAPNHRRSLDSSHHNNRANKRHTIHQTMTYYNLYFWEDQASSSSITAGSSPGNDDDELTSLPAVDTGGDLGEAMVRDNLSSYTIRPTDGASYQASPAIVGIRDHDPPITSRPSNCAQSQQGGSVAASPDDTHETYADQTAGEQLSHLNQSLVSALTQLASDQETSNGARPGPDVEVSRAGATDTTSLSFSVIAELEEDDMLGQCSNEAAMSPTSGDYNHNKVHQRPHNNIINNNNNNHNTADQLNQRQHSDDLPDHFGAHQSNSSGYDSLSSSCERHRQLPSSRSRPRQANEQACASLRNHCKHQTHELVDDNIDAQSDSSASDLVSPDQQLHYLHPADSSQWTPQRPSLNSRKTSSPEPDAKLQQHNSTSSTTTTTTSDSMMLTSEPFATPNKIGTDPAKLAIETGAQTGRRSLVSRARFFKKAKSKNRYWQLCMFVVGGKQSGCSSALNEPITIWRLYI